MNHPMTIRTEEHEIGGFRSRTRFHLRNRHDVMALDKPVTKRPVAVFEVEATGMTGETAMLLECDEFGTFHQDPIPLPRTMRSVEHRPLGEFVLFVHWNDSGLLRGGVVYPGSDCLAHLCQPMAIPRELVPHLFFQRTSSL